MLGRYDKQQTKAELETIDVMCGDNPEKTCCLVYGESLSTYHWV